MKTKYFLLRYFDNVPMRRVLSLPNDFLKGKTGVSFALRGGLEAIRVGGRETRAYVVAHRLLLPVLLSSKGKRVRVEKEALCFQVFFGKPARGAVHQFLRGKANAC